MWEHTNLKIQATTLPTECATYFSVPTEFEHTMQQELHHVLYRFWYKKWGQMWRWCLKLPFVLGFAMKYVVKMTSCAFFLPSNWQLGICSRGCLCALIPDNNYPHLEQIDINKGRNGKCTYVESRLQKYKWDTEIAVPGANLLIRINTVFSVQRNQRHFHAHSFIHTLTHSWHGDCMLPEDTSSP